MKFIKVSITAEEKLLESFKDFCKKNAMKVSTRLQLLMKKDMEKYNKNGR